MLVIHKLCACHFPTASCRRVRRVEPRHFLWGIALYKECFIIIIIIILQQIKPLSWPSKGINTNSISNKFHSIQDLFFFPPSTALWGVYSHSVHPFSTMQPLLHSFSIVPRYRNRNMGIVQEAYLKNKRRKNKHTKTHTN